MTGVRGLITGRKQSKGNYDGWSKVRGIMTVRENSKEDCDREGVELGKL